MFLLLLLLVFFSKWYKAIPESCVFLITLKQKRTIFFVHGRVFLKLLLINHEINTARHPVSVARNMKLPQSLCSHSFQCQQGERNGADESITEWCLRECWENDVRSSYAKRPVSEQTRAGEAGRPDWLKGEAGKVSGRCSRVQTRQPGQGAQGLTGWAGELEVAAVCRQKPEIGQETESRPHGSKGAGCECSEDSKH